MHGHPDDVDVLLRRHGGDRRGGLAQGRRRRPRSRRRAGSAPRPEPPVVAVEADLGHEHAKRPLTAATPCSGDLAFEVGAEDRLEGPHRSPPPSPWASARLDQRRHQVDLGVGGVRRETGQRAAHGGVVAGLLDGGQRARAAAPRPPGRSYRVGGAAPSSSMYPLTPTRIHSPRATLDWNAYAASAISDRNHPSSMQAIDAVENRAGAGLEQVREDLLRLTLDLVGERLDEPRAAERVGHVDHARLLGDHLLCAQGEARRVFGRQGERLVERVGMQALRAARARRPAPRWPRGRG